jgi:energy-coupling factor transport system substrate-specific component
VDVRGLVLIALLAAVGGVSSMYVGYLGNLVNRLFGVPFGAGQLIAGLHVVWPLLARLLLGRFGAGTLTGAIKGLVEFLSGGTHGVVIVLISFVEGLLVGLGLGSSRRGGLVLTMVAGAIASASNVFVFQALYFSGVSTAFILFMAGLALVSGATLGGYLAWDLRRILVAARLVRAAAPKAVPRRVAWRRHLLTAVLVSGLLAGAVYYFVAVFDPFAEPGSVRIEGAVRAPYTLRMEAWDGAFSTVTAELRGSVSYEAPRPYTGIPLPNALQRADPEPEASRVRVIADDGYEAAFELAAVLRDETMLLVLENGTVRLVAAAYEGSYWVRRVTRIVLE